MVGKDMSWFTNDVMALVQEYLPSNSGAHLFQ